MTALAERVASQRHFPDAGRCEQDCGKEASTVVVTVSGWLIDVCTEHARILCDPLG